MFTGFQRKEASTKAIRVTTALLLNGISTLLKKKVN
jgi:hypothetical protein